MNHNATHQEKAYVHKKDATIHQEKKFIQEEDVGIDQRRTTRNEIRKYSREKGGGNILIRSMRAEHKKDVNQR